MKRGNCVLIDLIQNNIQRNARVGGQMAIHLRTGSTSHGLEKPYNIEQREPLRISNQLIASTDATDRIHDSGVTEISQDFRQMMGRNPVFSGNLGPRQLVRRMGGKFQYGVQCNRTGLLKSHTFFLTASIDSSFQFYKRAGHHPLAAKERQDEVIIACHYGPNLSYTSTPKSIAKCLK